MNCKTNTATSVVPRESCKTTRHIKSANITKITVIPDSEHNIKGDRIKPSGSLKLSLQNTIFSRMGDGLPSNGDNTLDKQILKLKNRLYYIRHADELNKKRKQYHRQSWTERKDNPRYEKNKWCGHCEEWKKIELYRCDYCNRLLRTSTRAGKCKTSGRWDNAY